MKLKQHASAFTLWITIALLLSANVIAEDWPTYNHDFRRSAVTTEKLATPLYMQWSYEAKNAPRPAWPAPAKTDYWHREANLKPRVVYDRAFHTISIGNNVFFGSSADDKVYCLDAKSGKEKWSFFAGGPIRLAPTYSNGSIYVGSDDGFVYCLNSTNGKLVWKVDARTQERLIPGNERMISVNPVRTDVIVENGEATFFSGLLVNEGVQLFTVNAADGKIIRRQENLDLSPQGYLLASSDKLFAPTGRTTPQIFSRKDGKKIGALSGHGGTFALLDKEDLIFGGGDLGRLNEKSVNKGNQVATFEGLQMVINDDVSYLRSNTELSAINRGKYLKDYPNWEKTAENKSNVAESLWDLRERRKVASKENIKKIDLKIVELIDKISSIDDKKEKIEAGGLIWKQDIEASFSMILAGDILFLGGSDKIDAINAKSGEKLWSQKVTGDVYGLAAANGQLLASTSAGYIYSFASEKISAPQKQNPKMVNNPYKNDKKNTVYADALQHVKHTGVDIGYCLVVGSEIGRLAYELAKNTNLTIIGVEDDPIKVEKSRRLLDQAGLYGSRVSIQRASLKELPYSKYFANVIVSDKMLLSKKLDTSAKEISRVLKPFGGVACFGAPGNGTYLAKWISTSAIPNWKIQNEDWATVKRGEIKGAGEWTHLYANASNTSSSLDPIKPPLQVQWFGQPGPQHMINRHSRPMSTLFKDGRLFVPGDNRVIAVDAYNGTPLWHQKVPNSRVLGALKDCGTMAVTDDYLYIATENTCRALDVVSGDYTFTLQAPQLIAGENRDWGYTAVVDDQIFGSGKKRGASFTILGRFNCDDFEGDFREMVMSDYLFSLDRKNGKTLWTFQDGVVFNNTITIGGDYIYFIKSMNETAAKDPDGRMRIDYFCDGPTFIVKLDKRTGETVWQKPYSFPFEQIMFLSYAKNVLLTTGSFNKGKDVNYALYAFDGDTGKELWQKSYTGGNSRWQQTKKSSIGGSHGEQWQHPVIIEDTVYLPPHNFDLFTGKIGNLELTRGGGGCGGLSGSASNLFARGSNPKIYDISGGSQSGDPITRVSRPGCWINIIPAGDLISIPESSSGCTCDYPVQTSFVFVSKN
jgi:outer membrane protein assembly factor BamB